jgi:hypothetical protein
MIAAAEHGQQTITKTANEVISSIAKDLKHLKMILQNMIFNVFTFMPFALAFSPFGHYPAINTRRL